MASGYLDNLISAFGGAPEGPDPNRLEGLVELARQGVDEEVRGHLERMRDRVQAAAQERQGHVDARPGELDAALFGLLESNIQSCRALAQSLQSVLDQPEPERIDQLEADARAFLESCDRLSQMAQSSTPICPGCGSNGPEPMCPYCEVDRLIPDPEGAEREFAQVQVNDEFMGVYQAYVKVLNGQGGLAELMQALQPLEFSLLEAQALLQQAVDQTPEDVSLPEMLGVVDRALEGVNRMLAVAQNRSTRELHEGWAQVLGGASGLQKLIPQHE